MSSTGPETAGSSCRSAESDTPSARRSEVTPRRRIKMARWWDRLGGRPVDHTASPRSICRDTRHSYRYSKSKYRGRNHVIQQKCAKTECVRVNLPPHSTPLTLELYLRPLPDARQKAAISPFFSRCHGPALTAGPPIRVLCDTLISPKMWLPRGALSSGGTSEGPRPRSRQSTTTLISDTNGSVHPTTGSPDALLPVTPGRRDGAWGKHGFRCVRARRPSSSPAITPQARMLPARPSVNVYLLCLQSRTLTSAFGPSR